MSDDRTEEEIIRDTNGMGNSNEWDLSKTHSFKNEDTKDCASLEDVNFNEWDLSKAHSFKQFVVNMNPDSIEFIEIKKLRERFDEFEKMYKEKEMTDRKKYDGSSKRGNILFTDTIKEKSFMKEMEEIMGDRGEEYGPADDSFNGIASLWTTYLGHDITGRDVAIMMILLKIGRLSENIHHHDSYIDIACYSKLGDSLK